MKFVRIYILTFLVARGVDAGGEFTEADLHFIAARLNPLECSKLTSHLDRPKARSNWQKNLDDRKSIDDWDTNVNSREKCLASLYECNERGTKGGCTRTRLVASLRKFGRADLVAKLKRRWKMPTKKRTKSKKAKKKAIKKKSSRSGGKSDARRKSRNEEIKRIVKLQESEGNIESDKKNSLSFDDRLLILVAIGSLLIVGFLGVILFVAYRRACRCFKNHAQYNVGDEKRRFSDRAIVEDLGATKTGHECDTLPEQRVRERTKIIQDTDKTVSDERFLENARNSLDIRRSEIESLASARNTETRGCKCEARTRQAERTVSPCAKIKRFILSQKRLLALDRKKIDEKRGEKSPKIRSARGDGSTSFARSGRDVKRSRKQGKKSRKSSTKRKRMNRDKIGIRADRKSLDKSRTIGCTCDMCKLFVIESE